MMEFFAMGGYGAFVWSAWGTAFVLLLALAAASISSLRHKRQLLAKLEDIPQ